MSERPVAPQTTTPRRVAIIGAGPIGLEAAATAARMGLPFDVYEAGEVGANVRRWGHVVLFTPFSMNRGRRAAGMDAAGGGAADLPTDDACLTGRQYVDQYLRPLADLPVMKGRIHTRHRVVSVGRTGLLKPQEIGSPARATHPFRLLIETPGGDETIVTADVVIDASGTYDCPNRLGHGGVPALGERAAGNLVSYHIEDVLGADRGKYVGKRTVVIGAGYSAATTIVALHELSKADAATKVTWLTHGDRQSPIREIPDDRLPARQALARRANDIARASFPQLPCHRGFAVERLERSSPDTLVVHAQNAQGDALAIEADRVLANVGYHPDNSLYRELQVHECYATGAPMKLAAALMGENTADCLDRTPSATETLINPEPNFFILGAKSYGRDPTFLIQTGISHVAQVFSLLAGVSQTRTGEYQ